MQDNLRLWVIIIINILVLGCFKIEVKSPSPISKPITILPTPAASPLPLASGLTFGSSTLLNQCWSATELASRPKEKNVRRSVSTKNCQKQSNRCRLSPPTTALAPLPEATYNKNILGQSIRAVTLAANQKYLALTFDLCESATEVAGYDGELIDFLRQQQVKATFYAGGKWMASHPERTWQLMADPLFEIGNHTWSHDNLRKSTGADVEQQILWTQQEYQLLRQQLLSQECAINAGLEEMNKIPLVPLTFRFPYGVCNATALQTVARYQLPAIQWNIVTADPSPHQSAAAIVQLIKRQVKPGSIIVAHANGKGYHTASAMQQVVPWLLAQGYQLVTVSELLALATTVEAVESCYELTPGDNSRYDRLAKRH